MKKPEYKQHIIACKKCGGTNTRVYKFSEAHTEYGPTWYVECECGSMDEWPHADFTTIALEPILAKSDLPQTIRLDGDEK